MSRDAEKVRSINQEQERMEAETVLASQMFQRAPNLLQILRYVCREYFAGESARIKEYNIAVEALGRNPEFNPNEDTIVRVEASRLRKRLKEYYATEGAGHPIRLTLSKSGYVPQFVHGAAEADSETDESVRVPVTGLQVAEPTVLPMPPRRAFWIAGGMAVTLAAALGTFAVLRNHNREFAARESRALVAGSVAPGGAAAGGEEIRILAGYARPPFIDSLGRTWSPDRYFTGGRVSESLGEDILGVLDPTLYRTTRFGDHFRYDIPLKPGTYQLRLLFVEKMIGKGNRVYAGEASRVFRVAINGVERLSELDILADVGAPNVPADRVFKDIGPAGDGFLHLEFTATAGSALLNGIEILPTAPGKMRPVHIVAGGRSYSDRAGRSWIADHYFIGGRPLTKPTVVQGTEDPELYSNERWGNFSYSIPVPPNGRYKVTLKFAETNFGKSNPGRTGAGSRIFDVYCNGVALLRNFDMLRENPVENTAIDKVFRGLTPNAQGRLVFSFIPVKQYATVRAIEVLDDAP